MSEPDDFDPMVVLEEEARAVAQFFGVKACDVAAQMIAQRVATRLAGQEVYFSKSKFKRTREQAAMRAQFTGDNLHEVARMFGKSTRQARRIVFSQTKTLKK